MTPTREHVEWQVRQLLRGYGLRSTAQRLAILYLLAGVREGASGSGDGCVPGRHLTATQIRERLAASGDRMDATTVYRTLITLADLGLVHAVADTPHLTTYGLATTAHHHAVCTECGFVAEIPAADLVPALVGVGRVTGFREAGATITVRSLCADCRQA